MGIYNALFGVNPAVERLLQAMGLDVSFVKEIPRFRDVYFTLPDIVTIFTRTGGGNRVVYEFQNDALRQIKGFVSDYDDSFDSTYAHFIYKISAKEAEKFLSEIPEEHLENVIKLVTMNPTEKFEKGLEELDKNIECLRDKKDKDKDNDGE
jgi:hypothetical protein